MKGNTLEGVCLMNRNYLSAVGFLLLGLTAATFAQDPQNAERGRGRSGGRLKQMDANNDGSISREEWKGRPRMFERLDQNQDGVINREELANARREHGQGGA